MYFILFLLQIWKQTYISQMCPRAHVAQWARWLDYLATHTSLLPIRRGLAPGLINYKKGCTRLTAASDKMYQLLANGRWFSPGTPASSTTKTGRHDIAEILLKVTLNTINQIKSNQMSPTVLFIVLYYECVCIGSKLNLVLFNNEHSFQSFEFERDHCSLFCLPKSFCTN